LRVWNTGRREKKGTVKVWEEKGFCFEEMKTASSTVSLCVRVNACATDTSFNVAPNGSGKYYKYIKRRPLLSHHRSRSCSSVSPDPSFHNRCVYYYLYIYSSYFVDSDHNLCHPSWKIELAVFELCIVNGNRMLIDLVDSFFTPRFRS